MTRAKPIAAAFVVVLSAGCKELSTPAVEPDKETRKSIAASASGSQANTPMDVSDAATAPTEKRVVHASVYPGKDGLCNYMYHVECKPGWSCNPPPPIQVECPAGTLDSGVASTEPKPKGKEKWLRMPARMQVSRYGSHFQAEGYCKPLSEEQGCESGEMVTLKATSHVKGDAGFHEISIEPFEAKDPFGKCFAYEATTCIEGTLCPVPKRKEITCK